jgi:hypothetical protein
MPYVRPTAAQALSPRTVKMMAQAVGVPVPPEDLAPLATMLADQLASIAALEQLDLTHADPIPPFDPRWPAATADRLGPA